MAGTRGVEHREATQHRRIRDAVEGRVIECTERRGPATGAPGDGAVQHIKESGD